MGASNGRPMMWHSLDDLKPDERRREIAAILARGILRLHSTRPAAAELANSEGANHAPEGRQKDLEVSATSHPHVTTG